MVLLLGGRKKKDSKKNLGKSGAHKRITTEDQITFALQVHTSRSMSSPSPSVETELFLCEYQNQQKSTHWLFGGGKKIDSKKNHDKSRAHERMTKGKK